MSNWAGVVCSTSGCSIWLKCWVCRRPNCSSTPRNEHSGLGARRIAGECALMGAVNWLFGDDGGKTTPVCHRGLEILSRTTVPFPASIDASRRDLRPSDWCTA